MAQQQQHQQGMTSPLSVPPQSPFTPGSNAPPPTPDGSMMMSPQSIAVSPQQQQHSQISPHQQQQQQQISPHQQQQQQLNPGFSPGAGSMGSNNNGLSPNYGAGVPMGMPPQQQQQQGVNFGAPMTPTFSPDGRNGPPTPMSAQEMFNLAPGGLPR